MSKKMIIIGAGVAGLAAGCYGQMNGFETEIYEMHILPGGLCNAWERDGYTFDLCIHWFTGSSPHISLYSMWEELGLVQGRKFIHHEHQGHVIDEDGNKFILYSDPDKLREHMLSFSKEDKEFINSFTDDLKRFIDEDKPTDLFGKYYMPFSQLTSQIKNPVLRNFLEVTSWHDQSTIFMMMQYAMMGGGDGGYPLGGSLPLALALERRYTNLGGQISYKSKVDKIIVEEDNAVGIKMADGTEKRGDIIISAADGHSTIFRWLEGKFVDDEIKGFYDHLKIFPPLVFVSLGVNEDYSKEPHDISFPLKKPIIVADKQIDRINLRNHSFDSSLAPKGKTTFTINLETDYEYWAELENNRNQYLAEKKKIEESVVDAVSELYPDIKDKIEVIDVATPLTFIRFTGNWKGSYEGWLLNNETLTLKMPQTLPGLNNLYMAGQWVAPGGGLPGAAVSARQAVQLICENEEINFKTTKP